MNKRKSNGNTILKTLIENIIINLDELSGDKNASDFIEGGRYAFLECLEILSNWTFYHKYGIEDIYKKYPID